MTTIFFKFFHNENVAKFNAQFAKLVEFTLSKKNPNLFVENSEISPQENTHDNYCML